MLPAALLAAHAALRMTRPAGVAMRRLAAAARPTGRCPHVPRPRCLPLHRCLSSSTRPLLFPNAASHSPPTSPSRSPPPVQPAPSFSPSSFSSDPTPPLPPREWDVVIVGGGHNGLVAAAYLAGRGLSVAVLERRHVLGGAAVTEEVFPGYKYSRASYLFSLFRPQIVKGQWRGGVTAGADVRCSYHWLTAVLCCRSGAEAPRTEVLLP